MQRGDEWDVRRKQILKRDGHACRYCGDDETQLHVHHIEPYDEFETDGQANKPENLITLCASCHRRWQRLGLRMSDAPGDVEPMEITTLNIQLEDDQAERARKVKESMGLTWREFIIQAAEELDSSR